MALISDAEYDAMLVAAGGDKTVSLGAQASSVTFVGVGHDALTALVLAPSAAYETVSVTCTSKQARAYTVHGSVTGTMGTATAGVAFSCAQLSFLITADVDGSYDGDAFQFTITPLATVPCMLAAEDSEELLDAATRKAWGTPVAVTSAPYVVTVRTGALSALASGAVVTISDAQYVVDRVLRMRNDALTHFLAYVVTP